MRKLYIIGDAHLGAQGSEEEELKLSRLTSFLRAISREEADLLICGDLFDFWFEYCYVIPRQHYRMLALLTELVEAGINIHYMAGNHDFWFGSFMQNDVGMQFHPDDLEIEQGSLKLFIRHGDGLLKKDYLYRLLKKVFRCRLNIFLYRLLHPDLGVPLALSFSTLSRNASKNRPDYSDAEYRNYAYQKIDKGYDIVVLGHTHWAALEKHGSGWYLNPGNWMECFTYAVIEQDVPRLFQWDGSRGIEYHPDLPPGNLKTKLP